MSGESTQSIHQQALAEIETLALRQYLDWMHFHELAMAEPFEAESEAQDFARRVSSLATIALGADSTIEVIELSDGSKMSDGSKKKRGWKAWLRG